MAPGPPCPPGLLTPWPGVLPGALDVPLRAALRLCRGAPVPGLYLTSVPHLCTSPLFLASLPCLSTWPLYLRGREASTSVPGQHLSPDPQELQFTYIPSGAEIISIDAFNRSTEGNDFVIGVMAATITTMAMVLTITTMAIMLSAVLTSVTR